MRTRSCVKRTGALVQAGWAALCVLAIAAMLPPMARAQMSVTTVQGTIYRADGSAASGTALISWPAFSTAQNQAIAAGSLSATIGANGFLSVNLTPNAGAMPAGSYYTVVYHLSDGTVNREYRRRDAAELFAILERGVCEFAAVRQGGSGQGDSFQG